jgi:polynucleotide 5'-hydroxyl-kinase GRC3/NOL9
VEEPTLDVDEDLAASIAEEPYDGHISDRVSIGDEQELPQAPIQTVVPLSSFRADTKNVLKDDAETLELVLKVDESVTFAGEYELQVLRGVVNIYGAMIHPDLGPQRVYAFSTQALPAVTARKDDSAIRVTSIKSGITKLAKLSPQFRNIGANDESKHRSFMLLSSSDEDPSERPLVPLEIDEITKRVLSRINAKIDEQGQGPAAKIMAIGPKSSGKSTFNRLLCNMITSRPGSTRCLYLELDPGQPEFGTPGQISLVEVKAPLLGPSYTHSAGPQSNDFRLIRSHTIAATSFREDSAHYLACAADLFDYAGGAPLVVNSCGWTSGLGGNVLLALSRSLFIDTVVLLGEPESSDLVQSLPQTCSLHTIPKRLSRPSARSPAELRSMQTMAFLHQKANTSVALAKWNTKPISTHRPWVVSYAGETSSITAILSYGQGPNPDMLSEVLNGSIVAIVVSDSAQSIIAEDGILRTEAEHLPYVPESAAGASQALDPQRSHCVGIALVRGMDCSNKSLHLIAQLSDTDISELEEEGRQVVLVRGRFDAPEWAYLEDIHHDGGDGGKERPWVTKRALVGVEGSVWRMRHPPMASAVR